MRSGVSDVSEREVEREMVNPERSWSGAIFNCSEYYGEEIVGDPLRSYTLEPIDVVYTGCGAMRHDPHQ